MCPVPVVDHVVDDTIAELRGQSSATTGRVTVSVTDPGGAKRTLIFAATNSAAGQARANEAGVIGLDLSGGPAGIASQIQTALGAPANYTVSNTGSTIRILNNGTTTS